LQIAARSAEASQPAEPLHRRLELLSRIFHLLDRIKLTETEADGSLDLLRRKPHRVQHMRAFRRSMIGRAGGTGGNIDPILFQRVQQHFAAGAEERNEAVRGLAIYLVAVVLLYLIYFFIAKSESIRNSKEYGIYRAIGVNRSNLLFKECVSAVVNNVLSFLLFSAVCDVLIAVRYAIMNVPFAGFAGLAAAGAAAGACLMIGISLIPYLFVLTESPSEILARYDI